MKFADDYCSILALVVAAASLIISGYLTIRVFFGNRTASARFSATTKLADVELLIADHGNLLRFHGIDDAMLKAHGVDARELAYLIASFTLGGVVFTTSEKRSVRFDSGSYRDLMFQSPGTRKAWPLVERFIGSEKYKEAMNEIRKRHVDPALGY